MLTIILYYVEACILLLLHIILFDNISARIRVLVHVKFKGFLFSFIRRLERFS